MRRLLASVAVLAAALLAPSAAFAALAPTITAPTAGTTINAVNLTWTHLAVLPTTYAVFRSGPTGSACPTQPPGGAAEPLPPALGVLSFSDPVGVDGRYCYWVEADDGLGAADSDPIDVTLDTTPPVITVTKVGGTGCVPFTVSATAADNLPLTMSANGAAYTPGTVITPVGAAFASVDTVFVAADSLGNTSLPTTVSGQVLDDTRPPAPVLEVDTEPAQQKATLSWDNSAPDDGAPITFYRIRRKGPDGTVTNQVAHATNLLAFQGLQPDATYEFTLDATDACLLFGTTSVRLVRLNDTTPPSLPLVAQPAFDPTAHSIKLSWIPSTDNIQIDHYEILRNGVPLAATDAAVYTDTTPPQHTMLSYVVRAVDTNGNESDSAAATIVTPDWTPPTAPVLTLDRPQGTTVTLHWPAAVDNVGVVAYDILRDDKIKATVTGAARTYTYKDLNVPAGVHAWKVTARDDAHLSATSAPQTLKIVKPRSSAKVVSLKMVGGKRAAASRYSLSGPARLLLDLRVTGTLPKAVLRVYVQNGKGRITAWRGVPGSSSPRERLHSSLVRHGYVTIHLGRTFHSGRIRLVLITSGRMVVVGTGKHKPSIKAG
jgi:hypothetical protein